MASLATKYRPTTFSEMLSQKSIIKILEQQVAKKRYTNCYLFAGPSGVGKTTIARAFSKLINESKGEPIEIDAASNNGVDAVREIVNSANERAIDAEYKIYIIDEAHMISNAGWNAFLKCIEEPPKYTIFMFCTTNPEKIPATILNRVMRMNLTKIPANQIKERLEYICEQEHFTNYREACDYISRLCSGGARDAIAMLEKAAEYNTDLSIDNVLTCLGNFSYDEFFDLTSAVINADQSAVFSIVEECYNSGKDIKLFIESYLEFLINLCKFGLFKNLNLTNLPSTLLKRCEGYCNIPHALDITNFLMEQILTLKTLLRNDTNPRITVEIVLSKIMKECQAILEE